jgi:TolB protein
LLCQARTTIFSQFTIWINAIGSTDPTSRKAAAADLSRAIDASEKIARTAYDEIEMTRMMTQFK